MYAAVLNDGSVTIIPSAAPQDVIAGWPSALREAVLSLTPVATVPADRAYRNAWVLDGEAVRVDLEKARDVHRELLRVKALEKIAYLESQRQIHFMNLELRAQIEAQIAVIEALQIDEAAIDAAESLEELRLIIPVGLQ